MVSIIVTKKFAEFKEWEFKWAYNMQLYLRKMIVSCALNRKVTEYYMQHNVSARSEFMALNKPPIVKIYNVTGNFKTAFANNSINNIRTVIISNYIYKM